MRGGGLTDDFLEYLKNYRGRRLTLMEVCGSHTAAIARSGIKSLLSPDIRLISGPGCPVCVCPSGFIDRLTELAKGGSTIVSFGDLLRVPGSELSLNEVKGQGADVRMVYSPLDMTDLAVKEPEKEFVFAAVGFETTIPVYCLLLEEIIDRGISNIKLLTALKTMGPALEFLCRSNEEIDGFIAPGHVSVITGTGMFEDLSDRYGVPFAVTGFSDEELVRGIYGLVRACEKNRAGVYNFYPSVVSRKGNEKALKIMGHYLESGNALWRGMGNIADSGLYLKEEYSAFDAGSRGINADVKSDLRCCCDRVLIGKMSPDQCPLFMKECTPSSPHGACMVSSEGSCFQYSRI